MAYVLADLEDMIIVVDLSRIVRFTNRPGEGYTMEEMLGRDILEFVGPAFRDAQVEMIERVRASRTRESFEVSVSAGHGREHWHRGTVSPLVKVDRLAGYIVVTRNITAQRIAEEEARSLRRLVPICSWCKNIRSDEGFWEELEVYLEAETRGSVTHGVCPDCAAKHLGVGDEETGS